MGIGGGGSSHGYDWLEDDWLASWLSTEQVVEAVLGDPDPSGSGSVDGGVSVGDKDDDQVARVKEV